MSEITSNNNLRVSDKKGFFLSIRSKMLVYFGSMIAVMLIIFVLADIYGIPFTTFRGVYKKEQAEAFRNLNLVADLKKERLLRWMKERIDDTSALAENNLTSSCVASLLPVINENIASGARGDALLAKLQKEESYQTLIQQIKLVKETYGVYDKVQIADALTGIIIASTREEDIGKDISLHNSFINVLEASHHDAVNIDKDQLSGNLKLFVSHAIYHPDDEYKISSVLIMHINPDDLIRPMLHTGGGLGQTGETLLVNYDARILTALKFPLADGTTALPFEYQIKAKPATLAAQGEEGITIAEDYRGKKVLAAFRHARITSELGWGLVIKRDIAEVFAPVRESIYYRILISSVCAFLMFVLTTIIARNLTRPIQHLSRVTREAREGNLNVQAHITTSDEVGVLGNTFNEMLNSIKISQEEIKKHRDHLGELVDKRTYELGIVNEALRGEIAERKRAEEAMNTLVMTAIENEGQKFFEQTVSSVYDWLGVDCVILGQLIDENIETTLAMKLDGKFVDNLSYELPGSPCGVVSEKGFCFYPEGVIDLFPDDKTLVQWNIEGYVGISLKGKSGNCIGTLCALSHRRLELPPGAEKVFKIISARASVELERMLSEKRVSSLASILEGSLNEVFIFDADTLKFLQVNKGARVNLGYSNEELMEITPVDIKPEFTRESFEKKIELLRSGEKEKLVFESVHQRKDGSLYDVEIHLQSTTFESTPAFVALILDITDRKKAENALRDAYGELENKVKERTLELTEANASLEEKNSEHERINKVFVEREFRIKELRDRIKKMEG